MAAQLPPSAQFYWLPVLYIVIFRPSSSSFFHAALVNKVSFSPLIFRTKISLFLVCITSHVILSGVFVDPKRL